MKWTLLKISATVETEKETLVFNFSPQELILVNNEIVFDTITMKEFIDKIGEKVIKEYE